MMNKVITKCYEDKDCNITYKFKNGNPNVVFLHGLSGTKEYFDQAFSVIANLSLGIISIDIPGFGDSEVLNGDYSIKTQAKRISRVINKLNLKDVYLVGHSYSGPICYEIYRLFGKEEIKGIILPESSIKPNNSWTTSIASKTFDEYKNIFQDTYKNRKEFYRGELVEESDENLLILIRGLEKTTAEAMYYSSKELIEYCNNTDIKEQLSLSDIPVVYILSSKNESLLEENENLKYLIDNNVKIKVIKNSGHCMMIDNPLEFYRVIYDFIKQNDV